MKIVKYITLILVLTIGFSSCKNTSNNTEAITYQCPMKCEGEKTFTAPGSCSVC